MLLARSSSAPDPMRGVFKPGDSWVATGDLFRRDEDGDFWMVGRTAELIRTPQGPVPTGPIRDRLADVQAVDLAVVYGIPVGRFELLTAAVTLRAPVAAAEFTLAFSDGGPALIRVVEEIPASDLSQLRTAELREAGIPEDGTAFYRDENGAYRPLTDNGRKRLRATR
jgi:putative long chain acyl-CoA synthase